MNSTAAAYLLAFTLCLTCSANLTHAADPPPANSPAIITQEFIFESAPFRSCHASTIAQTPEGFAAAWFGGKEEGAKDVGIWLSRKTAATWTTPVRVAAAIDVGGQPVPCWNPVLFQQPAGELLLFYKAGPNPSKWWGMLITSADAGKTWSTPRRLPDGILGPIKNKPVLLPDGTLLCGSSTEDHGWRVQIERTPDRGKTWTRTDPLNDGHTIGAIQPTLLPHSADSLQFLCRTRQGKIYESWSKDAGRSWSKLSPTVLPNPNSGIDAVVLKDGRSLLVYNHTIDDRSPLNLAISPDGKTWKGGPILENEPGGEFSYPAVIQSADGLVHITYTWKRERIRHVVLDPTKLRPGDLPAGPQDRNASAAK